ncbi:exocyst complex subunit Sec15-like-domain-containing protein [Scheffersomyces xylosifermentans]|uniref:exocyst complex subunit Sec15-like-domain-containing protein n=1 Tax=Scheffersomyces xylosifermentans TaxID=1304137 RepID=UPI00315C52CD
MAPSVANGNGSTKAPEKSSRNDAPHLDTVQIENLLIRDENIYETSLNSDDYLESLAPIIQDAISANGLSDLISRLNGIVKVKDEELNELSLNSTDEINSCIDAIDDIHGASTELNKNLISVSQTLNKSAFELMSRKKSLIKNKEVSIQINETCVVLGECIQVLEITNKIHELIKQKKYFSALKLINELTAIHLHKVEGFSFAKKIYDSIPHLTKMIKDESFENLCNWLTINSERKLNAISDGIYDNLYDLQDNWNNSRKNNSTFTPYKLNSPVELSLRSPQAYYNIFEDSTLAIRLETIFDAILVYETLHEGETLSTLYHKEWMKKYNRVIYPITSATAESIAHFNSLQSLDEYLRKISAFFVMDKQINLVTKFELRSNPNSDDLWESYVTKLIPVLLNFLKTHKFKTMDELQTFKEITGNFLQIMENYNYRITELYEVLMILFKDYFAPILIQEFRSEFIESIQSDHYMPLTVDQKSDYENIMKICWYRDDAPFAPKNVKKMPITFPFSEDYVHYCLGVRSLLDDILNFISQHYSYELNELNNLIVNDIFERVLGDEKGVGISRDIQDFIAKNENNKEVTSQSYTNLEYYLYSLYEIGKLINRRLRTHTGIGIHNIDANDTFTLRAVDHFNKLKKYSESTIFKMVDSKIRELLDMVEYDEWLPTIRNSEANYSIKDFALFLDNLFTSIFSNLPQSIRTLGLFRSYDFVAEHFLNVLNSATIYNKIAIENFDLDIKYVEESMKNLYSVHQSTETEMTGGHVALETTFTELRQCIDLLLLDNYDDFIKNSTFRMRSFDRIRFEDGMKLIEKMKEYQDGEEEPIEADDSNQSLDQQSILSTAAASKFAQFTTKFRKKNDFEKEGTPNRL